MRKMVRIGRKTWPTLTVPTLVIQGGKDPASPVANGENVYAAIKHAQKQYAFFPDAGHELMRPFDPAHTDVWRLIHSFLQQHVSF
jgi:pimeloyl-ACP methyl ester carboxylesterase